VQAAIAAAFAWKVPDPILDATHAKVARTHHKQQPNDRLQVFHGGATVDLRGGSFLVNTTLWLGTGLDVRVCCGSLLASAAFPQFAADGTTPMFMVAGSSSEDKLEGLTLHDVFFDCNRRAAGVQQPYPHLTPLDPPPHPPPPPPLQGLTFLDVFLL
jgi:hypothetical protein